MYGTGSELYTDRQQLRTVWSEESVQQAMKLTGSRGHVTADAQNSPNSAAFNMPVSLVVLNLHVLLIECFDCFFLAVVVP
jgi:hypothetical protein